MRPLGPRRLRTVEEKAYHPGGDVDKRHTLSGHLHSIRIRSLCRWSLLWNKNTFTLLTRHKHCERRKVVKMQFGIMTIGDVTVDPTTGIKPSEHERINAMTEIALKPRKSVSTSLQPASTTIPHLCRRRQLHTWPTLPQRHNELSCRRRRRSSPRTIP